MVGRKGFFRPASVALVLFILNKSSTGELDMSDDECIGENVCYQPFMDDIVVDGSYHSDLSYKLLVRI